MNREYITGYIAPLKFLLATNVFPKEYLIPNLKDAMAIIIIIFKNLPHKTIKKTLRV